MGTKAFRNQTKVNDWLFDYLCFRDAVPAESLLKRPHKIALNFEEALSKADKYYTFFARDYFSSELNATIVTANGPHSNSPSLNILKCFHVVPYSKNSNRVYRLNTYKKDWYLSGKTEDLKNVMRDYSNLPISHPGIPENKRRIVHGLLLDRRNARDPVILYTPEGNVLSTRITNLAAEYDFMSGWITFGCCKTSKTVKLRLEDYNLTWYAYCEDFTSV
jgi:hypothetical protein